MAILTGLGAFFGIGCESLDTRAELATETMITSDETREGIEFRLDVPETGTLEDDLIVTLTIRNNRNHPITYPIGFEGWPYFRMRVFDARGERVLSRPGRGESLVYPSPGFLGFPNISRIDQGREKVWDVNLHEFFQISSGDYFLNVEIHAYDTGQNPRFGVIDYDDEGRPLETRRRTRSEATVESQFKEVPITVR